MINLSKKIAWVSYDAINSLVIIAGAVYFTKWMIADAGISDTTVALTVSLASIVFIFIAPSFGSRLRTEKSNWRSLLSTTICVGILATFLGLPGLVKSPPDKLLYGAMAAFFFLNVLYQMSLVTYNSYLTRLVTRQTLQKYSGFGEASGQIGSIIGIFLAIALLSVNWFEIATVRIFFVLGPTTLILSLLAVVWMRKTESGTDNTIVSTDDYQRRPLKDLFKSQYFFGLIVVVFLYNNAFAALQVFSSSYLALAAGWEEKTIGLGIAGTLLGAAIGSLTVGMLKRMVSIGLLLIIGLIIFALSITSLAILGSETQILLSLVGGGFGFGSLAATARICIVILAKDFAQGEKFGVYAAVSRTSAVVGPLFWAIALASTKGTGEIVSRQVGMASLAAIIWAGLLAALLFGLQHIDIEEDL